MKTTAKEFYDFYAAIPDENWYTENYTNPRNHFQKCAYGHLGCNENNQHDIITESSNLSFILDGSVAAINDGKHRRYQQKTPKERILAALKDVMKQYEN